MALVALDPDDERDGWGVARLIADPDNLKAEFAVIVRSDRQGRGLGTLLMQSLLAYAEARGIGEVWGDVLAANRDMLTLAKQLGFTASARPDDRAVVRVTKRMAEPG